MAWWISTHAVGDPVATGMLDDARDGLRGSLDHPGASDGAGEARARPRPATFEWSRRCSARSPASAPDFLWLSLSVVALGGSELSILVNVSIGASFYGDVVAGYSVHFASSTCACDVLDGSYPAAVPEPGAAALLGGACAWLWLRARGRFPLG